MFKTSHERIYKLEDGSRLRICIDMRQPTHGLSMYSISVWTAEKNKRKWENVVDSDSYLYRRLSMDERRELASKLQSEIATPERIQETLLEYWETLKPNYAEGRL